ncbi:hypothetical protein ECANGB1_1720 [Enterospora canceri]|uniref:Lunapark zinc ribbon domain-containing protein n=1 Tax=Enterospora canceri TaxID=1081671 RepID=A0A1Y1SA22_9MICR|nr:hypothetical protein ECANGB1_1720 [Enterospora canceri]
MAEYKLKKLREEQKNCVKYAKEDVNFAKTRRLIEKYEDEKMKEAFFKTVVKRKHTNASKLADFILANDPNKMNALICKFCGQHNGLVDPRNPDITHFYCYDCKKRNDRVGIEEMKDEDTLFEEKMEEALTKEAD